MTKDDSKLLKMTQKYINCQWLKMTQDGSKCLKMTQNYTGWLKMIENDSKMHKSSMTQVDSK